MCVGTYIDTHTFLSRLVKSVQCFKHHPRWAIKEVMEIFNSPARRESCGNTMGSGSDAEMEQEKTSSQLTDLKPIPVQSRCEWGAHALGQVLCFLVCRGRDTLLYYLL